MKPDMQNTSLFRKNYLFFVLVVMWWKLFRK